MKPYFFLLFIILFFIQCSSNEEDAVLEDKETMKKQQPNKSELGEWGLPLKKSQNITYKIEGISLKDDADISPMVLKKLKKQGQKQASIVMQYDLDGLEQYAVNEKEMNDFFTTVFDKDDFMSVWNFFDRTLQSRNIDFVQDKKSVLEVVKQITSKASLLRIHSQASTFHKVELEDDVLLKDIIVNKVIGVEGLYNITALLGHNKGGMYAMRNVACWNRERACLNYKSWVWLGRFNPENGKLYPKNFIKKPLEISREKMLRKANKIK